MIGLDRIDVLILKELIENGKMKSYSITKRVFKLKKSRQIRDKSNTVNYKLKRLIKLGVVNRTSKKKQNLYFIADSERCFLFKGPVIHGKFTTQMEEGLAVISKSGETTTVPIKLL